MSIPPCPTSQEAMHIHGVWVKSTAHPAIHRAQGPLASVQLRTQGQRLCTVSAHFHRPLYLHLKAHSNPNREIQKHTHNHTHALTCSERSSTLAFQYIQWFRLPESSIASHQTCPRWHLALCARVLLCRPICVGSKVMARPGRGYRWADENSGGSV